MRRRLVLAILVCGPAVALVSAAGAATALAEGCTRAVVPDGLTMSCTVQAPESAMKDTFVRKDTPDGVYGSETRLQLPLHPSDPRRAGLILLDFPALARLRNATIEAATLRLALEATDVPIGAGADFGVWAATSTWPEAARWDQRPHPRMPWADAPEAVWTLPAARALDPAEATWDVQPLAHRRLVEGEPLQGFVLTNSTPLSGSVSDRLFSLSFHSSGGPLDLRPSLAFDARLSSPKLHQLDHSGVTLLEDGQATASVAYTNGRRVDSIRAVVRDTGGLPAAVLMNFTSQEAGSRFQLTFPLSRTRLLPDGAEYRLNQSLNLPAGEYRLGFHAVDADGYPLNVTDTGRTTTLLPMGTATKLVVDREVPVIDAVAAPADVTQGATVQVSVLAHDTGGAVPLRVNATYRVGPHAVNLTLSPMEPTRFEGQGVLRFPGNGTLHVTATDAGGNVAQARRAIHVVDDTPPGFLAGTRFATNATAQDEPAVEAGGVARVLVHAVDDTPVRLRVRLSGPLALTGAALARPDGPTTINITVPDAGLYTVNVEAINADGANAFAAPVTLRVVPAAPPQITLPEGLAPGVLGTSPVLRVVIEDTSLASRRVHVNLTSDGARLTPGIQRGFSPGRMELRVLPGPQFNGTRLVLAVAARDEAGRWSGANGAWLIDGAGPRVAVHVRGPGVTRGTTHYVTPGAEVVVEAADALLPVRELVLEVDEAGRLPRSLAADEPIPVLRLGIQGDRPVTLRGTASDTAGNPSISAPTTLVLDGAPPVVAVGATSTGLRLSARDDGAGVASLEVQMAIGDGAFGDAIKRTAIGGAALLEIALPTDAPRGTEVRLAVTAEDVLGNVETRTTSSPLRVPVPNHPPGIQLESPAPGTRLTRTVRMHWVAADLDGDQLSARVAVVTVLSNRTDPVATNLAGPPAQIDTSRFLNGPHFLVLTVRDAEDETSERVAVTFDNPGRDVGIARTVVTRGAFTAEVESAQPLAALFLVATPPRGPPLRAEMHDDGVAPDRVGGDGVWTARMETTSAGAHALGVEGVAADGSTVEGGVGAVDVPGADLTGAVPWIVAAAVLAGAGGVAVSWYRRRAA